MGIGVPPEGSVPLSIAVAIGTFLVTLCGSVWATAWKLSNERRLQDEKMNEKVGMLIQKIADTAAQLRSEREQQTEASRKERTADIDSAKREMGEGIRAVRQKANDVEDELRKETSNIALWVRDNLARRSDFESLRSELRDINSKMDGMIKQGIVDRSDRDTGR